MSKKTLKQKKVKKVRKRCENRNKTNKMKTLKVYGINSAGIKCKLKSFENVLSTVQPQLWMLQETKLRPNETIKCEGINEFQVYYLARQQSQGGGLALGVIKELESTLVREGDDTTEAISVQVVAGKLPIRVVLGYGPQENAKKDIKDKFWKFLEEEVIKTELEGHGLMLQMDGNLHSGPDLMKNDPNPQNKNGKMFMDFLERNPTLIVVNSLQVCEGLITRKREVQGKIEESVLDFFIINEKMRPFLQKMLIDEDRKFSLSNFAQMRQNKRVIESDHNPIIVDLNIHYSKRKPERIEMFNLKNEACQEKFKSETENNSELLNVFSTDLPFQVQSKQWLKIFNSVLYKCFKKVRIVKSKKKEKDKTENNLVERISLKKGLKDVNIDKDTKDQIEERIRQIEKGIESEISDESIEEIVQTLRDLNGDHHSLGPNGRQKMWKLLKKKYPKNTPIIPVGKKDRYGNL